jgi:hypothetical protein
MNSQPTLSPIEAVDQVRSIGTFSCEGFVYEMDEDNFGVIAENLETGMLWACSGDIEEPVNENTIWVDPDNF